MPLLFAGGVCCCVVALGAVEVLEEAGVAVAAVGADVAGFAAGVAALFDEAAGAGVPAKAAGADESAEADFFELRDFFGEVVESVAVFASAAVAASSVDFLDFEERFLGLSVAEPALSAAVAESEVSDFFERLFAFGLEEVSAAAESVADESDFFALALDFGFEAVAEESAAAAPEDWAESSAAAFFFDFDLDFAALLSV